MGEVNGAFYRLEKEGRWPLRQRVDELILAKICFVSIEDVLRISDNVLRVL